MDKNSPVSAGAADVSEPDFWKELCARRDARPAEPWNSKERAILADFNRRVGGADKVLGHVEALGDRDTLLVVAGQQAGLFLCPLYALYKAAGAILWARRLSQVLDRPVAPAFWIVSEDHDFEEVRHAHYLNRRGEVTRWTYAPSQQPPPGTSIFDVAFDPAALGSFLTQLHDGGHDTEFKESLLEWWRGAIAASRDLEELFARGMMHLLGSWGLVLISSRLGPIRRRAAAVLEREIDQPGESAGRLRAAAQSWKEAGENPPLHRRGNEANFFLYRRGVRCKVTVGEGKFLVHHPAGGEVLERLTAQELRQELAHAPENFSLNVVTRPVVQDHALPTLAMMAGPGEVRYLSLMADAGIHDFSGVFPSQVLRRPRALLVEPRIERHLAKHGIESAVLAREDWEAVKETLTRGGESGRAIEAVEDLRAAGSAALAGLPEGLGALAAKPSISSALEKTAKAWGQAADRLEERVRKEIELEQQAAGGHRERVLAALCPGGQPQERVLGPLAPFLLNYGPDFVPWLIENLNLDEELVQILFLSNLSAG